MNIHIEINRGAMIVAAVAFAIAGLALISGGVSLMIYEHPFSLILAVGTMLLLFYGLLLLMMARCFWRDGRRS